MGFEEVRWVFSAYTYILSDMVPKVKFCIVFLMPCIIYIYQYAYPLLPKWRSKWWERKTNKRVLLLAFFLFVCLPAAGVMQTRPVIMPCTAPITDGFLKKMTSSDVHTKRLAAAHTFVFKTAIDESILAEYGSPPLNPAHPSHSNPAPANVNNTLLGGNLSLSLVNLGPT